ncbi:alpha-amylase family glycosyl hydrolase [Winogradskyella litorisediminis]|uniref:Alpha-amylase family glycosyl hydrolase n=1 Tax=Winogradskyella litorisediminis TaxID=1156618 RepID=A0ABW3N6N7_9FLAO
MKRILLIICLVIYQLGTSQQQDVIYEISPCSFDVDDSITITIQGSSLDEAPWGITNGANNGLYLWAWRNTVSDTGNNNDINAPSNGAWTSSNEANRFTFDSTNDIYTFTLTPQTFYGTSDIGNIGFLVKPKDGNDGQSQDIEVGIGESAFTATLTSPSTNTLIISSGDNVTISASNTCGLANYSLSINGGTPIVSNNVETFSYTDTSINTNRAYSLTITQGAEVRTLSVTAVLNPSTVSETIPSGLIEGINYDSNDDTKATLVLNAPGKDYIYVAGSFNNYQPTGSFAMKKDSSTGSDLFFLELTNLSPGQIYTYQYWVVDETPIANSPSLVKTADPYSTLVLSNFDDPFIPASTYPNLPAYPAGQNREVTVLQTAKPEYNWQVNNFQKPKIEDLVVYEVLVRDFDANRNYQNLIDRIDYFKGLNINAIHLMPVMEFEGNESWGYNTSFHMALDKFYGTEDKLKEFIDLCHQNGIAVILDVVLNHAFGRNPWVRMWMTDPDGDGWGDPSIENPYFNVNAKHSFNVGYDFSHTEELPNTPSASSNDDTNPIVNQYVERVIKHWVEEFKIDGFRWDLTKGFTQNCSGGDDNCTNTYQQDRIDILRSYADYAWSLDPTHYTIFEHLGDANEESQWANYRLNEGKGIMMWGKMTDPYSVLSRGYPNDPNGTNNGASGDLTGVGHNSRGFQGKRLLGYAESHDEERVMYYTLQNGNPFGSAPAQGNLANASKRAATVAATLFSVPGPKMIWHFGDLGMDNSIFTCSNGSVNTDDDPSPGDCKLDTKPQPQWIENWLTDPNRSEIYDAYSRLIALKINEPIFEKDYAISPNGNNLRQRIYVFDNSNPGNSSSTELLNVVVLANFAVASQNITPDFPYTGEWYDLMDETGSTFINVTNTSDQISIPAGEFRIFGNAPAQALSTTDFNLDDIKLFPNPASTSFSINLDVSQVGIFDITGKNIQSFKGNFSSNTAFNIENLKAGIYLVNVATKENRTKTFKLIKQ